MGQIIETNRLKMRYISQADAASIFKLRSAPETFKYADIPPYENIMRAKRFIKSVLKDIKNKEAFFWCIELKDKETQRYDFVGTICLWNFDAKKEVAEMGYEVLPEYYNRGIATEAIGGIINFIKNQLEIKEVHAVTHELNLPSIKLLMRYNFERKGIANDVDPELDEPKEMILYALRIMRE